MPQLKFPLVSIYARSTLLVPSLLYTTPPFYAPLFRFYSSHILANSVYLSNFCHLWPTYFEVSPSVCRTPHTPHTHTQSLHNRPHNNNSISQPSSSCLLLSPSHFLPSQSTGDRATFMPKLCQLFADLAFAACADFDFWFEFKMPATTTTITICIPHIHSHTLSLEFHFMRIVAAFKHILRSSSSR